MWRITFFLASVILTMGAFFFTTPSIAHAFVVGLNVQQHSGTFDAAGQAFTKELGAHSIRIGYEHGDHDFGVNWADQNGVGVIFFLGYGAGCDAKTSSGRQCYADRSADLVQQYGSKVQYWEVWNEWDGGFGLPCKWGEPPCNDAAMYTDLLCRTYKAIKAVRPSAIVSGGVKAGGTTDAADDEWFVDMLDAGAGNCMDVYSQHLYIYSQNRPYSIPPDSSPSFAAGKFVEFMTSREDLMKQKTGRTIPILVSEAGYTGNSEQQGAEYLTEMYRQSAQVSFIEGIWWYQLEDAGKGDYGLLRSNNTKKPSFFAFQAAAQSTTPPPPDPSSVSADSVSTPPAIDGSLSETSWNLQTNVTKHVIGTGNNTVAFDAVWDNTYLYVGAKVLDVALNNDSTNIWDDDSVEIYVDPNHSHSTAYDATDVQFNKPYNDSGVYAGAHVTPTTTGVLHGWAAVTGGYTVELAIPWTKLGVTPTHNMTIGFDVGVNDDDNGAARDSQMMWAGTTQNFQNTAAWGDLTLAAPTSSSTPCHLLTPPSSTIPPGFAPPWNVYTNALWQKADCNANNTVLFTLGDAQPTTYAWKQGYYTKNGTAWEPVVAFTGSTPSSDANWFIGTASFTTPVLTNTEMTTQNSLASYLCTYQSNAWKCGCTNATSCTPNGLWGVQGWKR